MRKLFVAAFCFVAFWGTETSANTIALTLTEADGYKYMLGEVFVPGDLTGGQVTRDAAAVNLVLDLPLGGYSGPTDPSYFRSTNDFGSLSDAVTAGAQVSGGSLIVSGNLASLTLSQSYQYLIVTYDGPNGGGIVWYTGGIASGTNLEFARYAYPTGTGANQHMVENTTTTQYGITHWTLLNPTTSPTSVPDGGSTLLLLGSALIVIAALQRRLRA
jgi:hypothetical protein